MMLIKNKDIFKYKICMCTIPWIAKGFKISVAP